MKSGLRGALRAAVSAALIAVLVVVAYRQHVWEQLRNVPPKSVGIAAGLVLLGWLVNSVRWNLLLRVVGVHERQRYLSALYFIGGFLSQLLPTGAGGDAVRMWDLYRRGHKPAAVVVATLQERLMGMGVSMFVGLAASLFYFHQLPPGQRILLIGLQIAAIIAVGVFLYPRIPIALIGPAAHWGFMRRITAAIRPAAHLPHLTPTRLFPIAIVTLAGIVLSIAAWYALGVGVGINVPFGGFCLVIPLVWIISMIPSLGGAGVREGGFVLLMREIFNSPSKTSLAVAALYFIVQMAVAAMGGLILLWRIWRGSWKGRGVTHTDKDRGELNHG